MPPTFRELSSGSMCMPGNGGTASDIARIEAIVRAVYLHQAPMPEEEPLPGEEPAPDEDPVPHPDPVVREPGEATPIRLARLHS